jgi:macrolide transport system ATP-binding/permease protein
MNPFRRRPHTDFSAELQAHLELEQDRLRAEGLCATDAYYQARKNLGNLANANERFYESSRCIWLEQVLQDTRLSLRQLRLAPAFAVTAILTLALGIGVTTAVFTLVHAVILKSLPVSSPSQLYRLGKDSHCCVFGGYSQGSEFFIVSYEL